MKKRAAIFLDRDGVLTVEKSYITKLECLEVFSFSRKAVDIIHKLGYYAIVITNQSAVARGLTDIKELEKMNSYLINRIGVDSVYYCPHYANGSIDKYTIDCQCRKPRIGLIKESCIDYEIDLEHSYFVGDRATDILTGKNAGIQTILVESGYGREHLEENVKPDYMFNNLLDFANYLVKKAKKEDSIFSKRK